MRVPFLSPAHQATNTTNGESFWTDPTSVEGESMYGESQQGEHSALEGESGYPEDSQPATQQPSQTQPAYTSTPKSSPDENYAIFYPTAPHLRETFKLRRDHNRPYVFGRSAKMADFEVPSKLASSTHCRVWLEPATLGGSPEVVIIEDLSSNGLYIDGQKMGKGIKAVLQHGSEVIFGPPNTRIEEDFRYIFRHCPLGSKLVIDPQAAGGLYVHYDMRDQIGKGSFATVKRAINRQTGEFVAVKIIHKRRFINNPKTFKMLEREVEIIKSLKHHHIVEYENYFEDDEYMYIVMEFVDGGDLLDYAINRDGLQEEPAAEIARQICLAVEYLHKQGICHRDLKPDNVLLTRGESPIIKVSDFGLAKIVDNQTFLKTACGTPTYLAPEVVLQQHGHGGYSFAVDAWSIGVIVYAILANSSPFDEDEAAPLQQRMRARQPDYQNLLNLGISQPGIDFIRGLLTFDPKQRMTASEALRHPWLEAARRKQESSGSISCLPPNDALPPGYQASTSKMQVQHSRTNSNETDDSGAFSQRMQNVNLNERNNPDLRKTESAPSHYYQNGAGQNGHANFAARIQPIPAIRFAQASITAEPSLAETVESQPFDIPAEVPGAWNGSSSLSGSKRKEAPSHFSDSSLSSLSSLEDESDESDVQSDTPASTAMDEDEKLEDAPRSSRRTSKVHPAAAKKAAPQTLPPKRTARAKAPSSPKVVTAEPEGSSSRRTSGRIRKQAKR